MSLDQLRHAKLSAMPNARETTSRAQKRIQMTGSCLCGAVKFEIAGDIGELYQCHCSLCRKTTGSACNTACLVPSNRFTWCAGINQVSSFVRDSGYRSDFCSRCGSPVPNPTRDGNRVWVPAGLFDEQTAARVTKHVFVGSRAAWDEIAGSAVQYEEFVP
jgi:hypothetical protein